MCRAQGCGFTSTARTAGRGRGAWRARDLRALAIADSVAVDPHKWLYAPLEAGCVLVRDPEASAQRVFVSSAYYHFDEEAINYFDFGPQNSRGFRALKVWLAFQQAGASGYLQMIADDIALSRASARDVRRAS